jgi:protein tyrosine phosphatase (PTP) superfamily phosphohydrolase (DUF442 family)
MIQPRPERESCAHIVPRMELVIRRLAPHFRRGLIALAVAALAVIAVEARSIYFGRNWHELLPGRIYRSAQLSGPDLAEEIQRHGIRTVINLRGTCVGFPWYDAESRTTGALGVSQEDVTLSATRLPAPDEVRRFVEVLDHTEYPIVLHCRQGVDRTGMMSAAALLLLTDTTPEKARRQLSPRFGHVAVGPTRVMTRFLELYDEWLKEKQLTHSRMTFRRWACAEYCPDECRGMLALLDHPDHVEAGEALTVSVRATNDSIKSWHLHPGTETGVHIRFMIFAADGQLKQLGRAGQFEQVVDPQGSIDLQLAIAPLHQPGRYVMLADLQNRNLWAFSQFGCDPVALEFEVTAP